MDIQLNLSHESKSEKKRNFYPETQASLMTVLPLCLRTQTQQIWRKRPLISLFCHIAKDTATLFKTNYKNDKLQMDNFFLHMITSISILCLQQKHRIQSLGCLQLQQEGKYQNIDNNNKMFQKLIIMMGLNESSKLFVIMLGLISRILSKKKSSSLFIWIINFLLRHYLHFNDHKKSLMKLIKNNHLSSVSLPTTTIYNNINSYNYILQQGRQQIQSFLISVLRGIECNVYVLNSFFFFSLLFLRKYYVQRKLCVCNTNAHINHGNINKGAPVFIEREKNEEVKFRKFGRCICKSVEISIKLESADLRDSKQEFISVPLSNFDMHFNCKKASQTTNSLPITIYRYRDDSEINFNPGEWIRVFCTTCGTDIFKTLEKKVIKQSVINRKNQLIYVNKNVITLER